MAAIAVDRVGAEVFDLNGVASTVEAVLDLVRSKEPQADLRNGGPRFPFPAELSDQPLGAFLGGYRKWSLEGGVAETLSRFRELVAAGKLGAADVS